MLGYVFINSGSVIECAERFESSPQFQIDGLLSAVSAMGEKEARFMIEGCSRVDGLRSLAKLSRLLVFATLTNDRVLIDHLSRLFVACPCSERRELLRQLLVFGDVIYELEEYPVRALSAYAEVELTRLLHVDAKKEALQTQLSLVTIS